VVKGFENANRGQMIMTCGTGKTLTALFIAERLAAKRTLVLVPSLSLLNDTLRDWTANAPDFDFLPVCSDDTVTGHDAAVSTTTDLGFPVTTDSMDIATFLRRRSGSKVVFSTYQSSPRIAEAFRMGKVPGFDLVIADEAHRCAGRVSSDFATVLDPDAIPAHRRLFMTATPRFFTGRVVQESKEADFEVASMDDESRFGPVLHRLGFSEAIERGLLTDYQVVVVGVDDATYLDWVQRGRFVTIDGTTVTDARALAGQIGLVKAMRRYDLRRTISFHSRVSGARQFASSIPELVDWMPTGQRPKGRLWSHYASGEMSAGERSTLLDHLRYLDDEERGLLANARCLGEGVDVPALDGVAFIDPRRSEVDIVQAVGRAIRLAEDKKVGTIVIPVFIETSADPEVALDGSAFKPVWDVVRALRAHDDEFGEQLDELRREIGRGAGAVRPPAKIHLDLPVHVAHDFASAFDVRLVESTTRSWEFWFGLLEKYVEEAGHSRVQKEQEFHGFNLGSWTAVQRLLYSSGRLNADRIGRLERLPGWAWNLLIDNWEQGFLTLSSFINREGSASVPQSWVENGYRLGQWVAVNRRLYATQRIEPDRVERLERLPGWSWTPKNDRWERSFRILTKFVAREDHAQVPLDHVEDGVRLGHWVRKQRHALRRRTSDERHQRLAGISGWTWDPYESQWDYAYQLLKDFAESEGHARVPQSYNIDGFRLGAWVGQQRTQRRAGRLSADRVQRLVEIPGWSWEAVVDQWESNFKLLNTFVEEHGHASVPVDHKVQGQALGYWVRTQRAFFNRGEMPADRAERLKALPGWTWDPFSARWEEGFAALSKYVAREGTARVRSDHLEEGVKLGQWSSNQRAFYNRGKLSPDRAARLEGLPGWSWSLPKGHRPGWDVSRSNS
jgi:superfamily II DNA or RNA helicase